MMASLNEAEEQRKYISAYGIKPAAQQMHKE